MLLLHVIPLVLPECVLAWYVFSSLYVATFLLGYETVRFIQWCGFSVSVFSNQGVLSPKKLDSRELKCMEECWDTSS